jgi:hypothetical protein
MKMLLLLKMKLLLLKMKLLLLKMKLLLLKMKLKVEPIPKTVQRPLPQVQLELSTPRPILTDEDK